MAITAVGKSSGMSVKMNVGTSEKPVIVSHALAGTRYGSEYNDELGAIAQAMVPLFDGTLDRVERSMVSILEDE